MQSLIRPLLTPWILFAAFSPMALYLDATLPLAGLVAMAAGAYVLLAIYGAVSAQAVHHFLAGLEAAGLSCRTTLKRTGWLGEHLVHAASDHGTWRLLGQLHRGGLFLEVRPPDRAFPLEIGGKFSHRGKAIGERLAAGTPSSEQADAVEAPPNGQTSGPQAQPAHGTERGQAGEAGTRATRRRVAAYLSALVLAGSGINVGLLLLREAAPTVIAAAAWLVLALAGVSAASLAALLVYVTTPTWPRASSKSDVWPTALGATAALGGYAIGVAVAATPATLIRDGSMASAFLIPAVAGATTVLVSGLAARMSRNTGKATASIGLWFACLAGVHLMIRTGQSYLGAFLVLGALLTLYLAWQQRNELL